MYFVKVNTKLFSIFFRVVYYYAHTYRTLTFKSHIILCAHTLRQNNFFSLFVVGSTATTVSLCVLCDTESDIENVIQCVLKFCAHKGQRKKKIIELCLNWRPYMHTLKT